MIISKSHPLDSSEYFHVFCDRIPRLAIKSIYHTSLTSKVRAIYVMAFSSLIEVDCLSVIVPANAEMSTKLAAIK